MNNKKCIIFGAGNSGSIAYRFLKGDYEVIGFADNDSSKWGDLFCGKPIYNPSELMTFKNVDIIISSMYCSLIYRQLKKMGITNSKEFVYLGSGEGNDKDKYMLCQPSDILLFSDCILDWDKIEKVEDNFSENYSLTDKGFNGTLNVKGKKTVLFCAYSFPPIGGGGVQRSLKFVKYLREFGYEPIVLTVGKNDGQKPEDFSMLSEVEDDIQIIRIDYDLFVPELLSKERQQEIFNLYMGVIRSESWMDKYRFIIQEFGGILIPDSKMIWVNQCLKEIEQKINLKDIDIIYTTGNPFSSFFLGYYIKKKYNTRWVIDYRDPWVGNDFYVETYYYKYAPDILKLHRLLEHKLVAFCDFIIGAADFKKDFIEKYGISADKFEEITNGYDENDFRDIVMKEDKNTRFTLCYNGQLYGNRSPLYLMEVINYLIEKGEVDSNKIQWIFNGSVEDKWKNLLDKEDIHGVLQYNGYLTHKESIISAMNSELLILYGYDGKGTEIGYSGKFFEYLRMKKPILGFSAKGGVYDKVFGKTHSGRNFEYEDIPGITEYLLDKYHVWEQGTIFFQPNEREIRKYERKNLTSKLADVFNKVLEKDIEEK